MSNGEARRIAGTGLFRVTCVDCGASILRGSTNPSHCFSCWKKNYDATKTKKKEKDKLKSFYRRG